MDYGQLSVIPAKAGIQFSYRVRRTSFWLDPAGPTHRVKPRDDRYGRRDDREK